MTFTNKTSLLDLNLKINNVVISRVKSHKHLGMFFNDKMTWEDHVNFISKKVSKKLGLLYKNKNNFSRNTLIRLYKSMITPIIDYGSVIYDNVSKNIQNKLENLHRRVALVCCGAHPRTETKKLLAEVGWVTLKERRDMLKLVYFYKIFVMAYPSYLNTSLIDLSTNKSRRDTRSSIRGKLNIPFCRTVKYKNSFFPSAIAKWNDLAVDLAKIDSLSKFKKYLNIKFFEDDRVFDYNILTGNGFKLLTQIRLGLSPLMGHRFTYNLEENPFCPECLINIENTYHFLMECVKYNDCRNKFLNRISEYLHVDVMENKNILVKVCVVGSKELDCEKNLNILKATAEFINSSKRFVNY